MNSFIGLSNRLAFATIISLFSIVIGCRGPVGPQGMSPPGFDTVPPTIKLIHPWPLSTQWDEILLEANAVDNVAVEGVMFSVDGLSLVGTQLLISTSPPYRFKIDAEDIGSGWHLIGARAYDVAGNVTDSPLIPINIEFSDVLQDTFFTIRHHNDLQALDWSLPDSLFNANAYWMRFNPPRDCEFDRATIYYGGNISDTSTVVVGLWSGAGFPETVLSNDTLGAEDVNGVISPKNYDFPGVELTGRHDYFIVLALDKWTDDDEITLASDDGQPPWGRSGSRDEDGWQSLSERYGAENNLMIGVELLFGIIEPDTSEGEEG